MKHTLLAVLLLASSTAFGQRYWIATTPSNWNNIANWSTSSGGPGGASVPGSADLAIFNGNGGRNGNCTLDIAPTIAGITVNGYTGTINLSGFTLTTTGTNTLATGAFTNTGGSASLALNSAGTSTFSGTSFSADITGSSGAIVFSGSTFNNPVSLAKTGGSTDNGSGNNTFNNAVTLQNSSTGQLRLGTTNPDTFSGTLNLIINSTGGIAVAYTSVSSTQFNQNVGITYNGTGAVTFGGNNGRSVLASGKTLTVSSPGAGGSGNLTLNYLTTGATAQSLSLSGNTSAVLTIANSSFGGALTTNSPALLLTANTISGNATFTKTGTSTDNQAGGNTFGGTTSITNNGTGELNFANTNPDTFNGAVTLTNTNTSRIQVGVSATGTVINGNLTINHGGSTAGINTILARNAGSTVTINGNVALNCTNTDTSSGIILANDGAVFINGNVTVSSTNGRGILFGAAAGSVTLGNGYSLADGAPGNYTTGVLSLARFTQTGGTAQALTLTGTSSLIVGPSSSFGGNVSFVSPQVYLNGTIFGGSASIEKNGATDNYSVGGNVFNGVTTITNSGSGAFILGNNNPDTFNGVTTFNDIGTYRIFFAHNHGSTPTTFATDVTLNANKSGGADGWSFFIGEGTNVAVTFGGNLTINCQGSVQSNIRFLNGNGSTASYNGTVTVNDTNSNSSTTIYMGYNGTSTYNGNIIVGNSGGANGIIFDNNAGATSTLADPFTISNTTYTSGVLTLQRFTQGTAPTNTPQNITLTGTAYLQLGSSSIFNGDVTFKSPQLYLQGCNFGGTSYLEKTGATDNYSSGGNTFSGATTLVDSGSGYLAMCSTLPDTYNGDLTVNNFGGNAIYIANNVNGTVFNGNITVNATSGNGIFFSNNSTGSSTQNGNGTFSIGPSGFLSGELRIKRFTQTGTGAVTLIVPNTYTSVLRAGPGTTFGGSVNASFPQVYLDGATYNGTATIEKNGAGGNNGSGGNVFGSTTTILNSNTSGGYLWTNGGNTFNGTTSISNTGSGQILLELNTGSTYNNDVTFMNSGTSYIRVAYNGSSSFNGNIVANSTGGNGVYFCENAAGTATLADGLTISSTSFSSGNLVLQRFTQGTSPNNTPQNLVLSNTALLQLGPSSTFNGDVNFKAPQLYLNGCYFTGTSNLEKTGASDNYANGGNRFDGATTITNSGSGYLLTGGTNADQFNAPVVFNNTGSYRIYFAHNHTNQTTTFASDVTLNTNKSGGADAWSYLICEGINTSVFFGGNLIINDDGAIQSNVRILQGTGSTALYNGSVTINATNTSVSTNIYMGAVGTSTYNGNIIVGNSGGIGSITFNNGASATSTLAETKTISNTTFSSGNLVLPRFTQGTTGNNTPQSLTLTNTASLQIGPSSTFNGDVNFKAPQLYLNGCTYAGTATLEKTGAGDNYSAGGNIFNGVANITNSGSGAFIFGNGNPDQFNAPTTFNDLGTYRIFIAQSGATATTFASDVTFNANKSGGVDGWSFFIGDGNNTYVVFNGNVSVNCLGNIQSNMRFANGSGSSVTYNGTVTINSTNTNASTTLLMGANGTSIYNGNIIVGNTGSSNSIIFNNGASATSTLPDPFTITNTAFTSGSLILQRFTQGIASNNTVQSLTLTGTALLQVGSGSTFNGNVTFKSPQLYLHGCYYGGTTYLEKTGAADNYSNGGNTFNGTSILVDSGSGYFAMCNTQPDIFNSDVTVNNFGTNIIYMANNVSGSQFNGNIIVNATSGNGIYFSNNATGFSSQSAGKTITIGASGFTSGELRIKRFTQNGAAAVNLAVSNTYTCILRVGPGTTFGGNVNFSFPQVYLDGAVYNGTALIEKNGATSNTGNGGNTFVSTATILNSNTSGANLYTNGNNSFGGATTITSTGSGQVLMELNTGSTYNGDVTFTNSGTSYLRGAYNGNTTFNSNIIVNSSNGGGVYFCENGTGTATLTNGTLSVGTGFSVGELRLYRFTQSNSAAASNIVVTGAATFRIGQASSWSGNFSVTAPILFLDGTTFNGATNSFTKNGTSTDSSVGGNTFGTGTNSTFTNSSTGIFRFANTTGDAFNGNVTFVQSSGTIQPAYSSSSTSSGDITVNSSSAIVFGSNGGTLTFSGILSQGINKAGSAAPTFAKVIMNKSGSVTTNTVTLNTIVNVSGSVTFTSGVITSSSTNYINFLAGSTVSGGGNSSYVDGPLRKVGNTAFTFPVGNNGIYRTIAISAPGTVTDHFTAQYFKAAQAYGGASTFDPSFQTLSSCEYWILNRTGGVSNVNVTLSWNSPDCSGSYITNLASLRVARWNGTQWANQGNGGTTGTATAGTVVSSGTVNSFSPFTIASTTTSNPLPIELVEFSGESIDNNVSLNWVTASEVNNNFFSVERSTQGVEFETIATVKGAGTKQSESRYEYLDINPTSPVLYYRLRQTDYNGKVTFSDVIRIVPGKITELVAYPIPVKNGGVLHINYTGAYQLFDELGALVLQTGGTNAIAIDSLIPGVYVLKASNGFTRKIVVE